MDPSSILPWPTKRKTGSRQRAASPCRSSPVPSSATTTKGLPIVAAAVGRAAGPRLDLFLQRTVFAPLCIAGMRWDTDSAGHAAGYSGLSISAISQPRPVGINASAVGGLGPPIRANIFAARSSGNGALVVPRWGAEHGTGKRAMGNLSELVANHLIKEQRP